MHEEEAAPPGRGCQPQASASAVLTKVTRGHLCLPPLELGRALLQGTKSQLSLAAAPPLRALREAAYRPGSGGQALPVRAGLLSGVGGMGGAPPHTRRCGPLKGSAPLAQEARQGEERHSGELVRGAAPGAVVVSCTVVAGAARDRRVGRKCPTPGPNQRLGEQGGSQQCREEQAQTAGVPPGTGGGRHSPAWPCSSPQNKSKLSRSRPMPFGQQSFGNMPFLSETKAAHSTAKPSGGKSSEKPRF